MVSNSHLKYILCNFLLLESMCWDFWTQKWNTVGLRFPLPQLILYNLYPFLSLTFCLQFCLFVFSFSLFCFYHFLSSLFHVLFPLFLSVLCSAFLCVSNSGRRWPNSSLKQRHSIYMQIRRRYVYALLKRCLFLTVELRKLNECGLVLCMDTM